MVDIKYCKCGCGLEVKGQNDYIRGHNRKGLQSCTIPEGKWAINYDKCITCGTTDITHCAKGMCKSCYKKYLYEKSKNKKRWSEKYEKCIDCGRKDRPYKANGRCNTCYVNNLNRKKGVKKRNIGGWSWYYDKCIKCGTKSVPHVKKGLCRNCYEESKRGNNAIVKCPVCGVNVIKLNQHLSMMAKKCEKHREYQYNLLKKYFDSDLGLDSISKELGGMDRHAITRVFKKVFGEAETKKRNKAVKSCLCSEKSSIGFNSKNRFGTVVYYKSNNNGKVRLRSKLERDYAEFLDNSNIKWLYENRSFPYIDKEGKRRTYTPDFYLIDSDEFIEVKGYDNGETEYKINALKKLDVDISVVKKEDFITK